MWTSVGPLLGLLTSIVLFRPILPVRIEAKGKTTGGGNAPDIKYMGIYECEPLAARVNGGVSDIA